MVGQTFESAEAFGQAKHSGGLQKFGSLLQAAFNVERHHSAEAAALTYSHFVLRMRRQARVQHFLDQRMLFKVPGDGKTVFHMFLHAHVQGLQAPVDQVTIERRRHDTARCKTANSLYGR